MLNESNLREGLFAAEPISPDRQQRFREEVARIMEPRLPRSHRLYYLAALLGSAVGFVGSLASLAFDGEHRWMMGGMAVVWAVFGGWAFHILRRSAEPVWAMQRASKVLTGLTATAAGVLIYYGLQHPSIVAVLWALAGLLGFAFVGLINLWNRILLAERTVRENVLRVEYRLADLAGRN